MNVPFSILLTSGTAVINHQFPYLGSGVGKRGPCKYFCASFTLSSITAVFNLVPKAI